MDTKDSGKSPWWQPGLILFFRLNGWIVGPLIIAIFVGKYLDKKYNPEPWLFFLMAGLLFVFSTVGIVKDAMKALNDIEKENREKK